MYHLVYAWSLSEYFAWPRPRQISPQARRSRRSWVRPNKEATTPHEGKSARSRRVGKERGVCGVARLVHSSHYGPRRAPCIRSLSLPTRLTRNTQTGSWHRLDVHSSHLGVLGPQQIPPMGQDEFLERHRRRRQSLFDQVCDMP